MKRILHQSFKYPEVTDKNRTYGRSFFNNPIIRPDGDWRKSLPPYEEQRRFGVEPSSCFIEAQQHAIATIEEDQLGEKDNNYSARFNALLSDGEEYGGDPLKGAKSITTDGLVKESSMPHDNSIQNWSDFHSWKGVDEAKVRAEGQEDLKRKYREYGVIVEKHYPLETKLHLMREGLKRSTIPMSIWAVTDENGNYLPKPEGVDDTHMVEATYISPDNVIWVNDTYQPFEKPLPPNYNFDFAMGWTVMNINIKKPS